MASSVSYNASSGVIPQAPDFFRFDANFPIVGPSLGFNAGQSITSGTPAAYEMGITNISKYTFWFTNTQTLDHNQTVEIDARVLLEAQTLVENPGSSTDRSGLGIAMTDDRNFYNELYINENGIFLNERSGDTRVRDPNAVYAMDTTSDFHDYSFRLQGDTITVWVDGIQRLTGTMFDTAGLSGVPTLPNWASIGDITSSAAGRWEMQSFSVSVVPEPVAAAILATTSSFLLIRRRVGKKDSACLK